ncbi:hypothetical protein KIN20_010418 [Parelaphostrongylus tenuis]|uniref:Uncharacterized protein n=1 Tax=Parelaphostrongylus tenuis TaxID=148309 RepID=A0AAD5MRW7_PARTN|nr:hypothetical protein KIN20_010418 [Parelaphostrongylus tenuis]
MPRQLDDSSFSTTVTSRAFGRAFRIITRKIEFEDSTLAGISRLKSDVGWFLFRLDPLFITQSNNLVSHQNNGRSVSQWTHYIPR